MQQPLPPFIPPSARWALNNACVKKKKERIHLSIGLESCTSSSSFICFSICMPESPDERVHLRGLAQRTV